ncbi:uncharacterized protein LOC119580142 [Penaeus monodon]|uniref:uncharacterized protein LOC119580142 n=1 Tax=Penaeus monodon TaxID=6687 RepID=UPI0018A6E896|nr:uncharacterized protein LOC119580142 [Penaeus monodon]
MAHPLSLEETLDGIAKIFEKELGKKCPKSLLSSLVQNAEKAEMSEDVISMLDKKLKTWHTQNKICLVEADVPSTILPFGYTASLVDVRVKSRGPDDTIYKNNPEIRSMVPRGLTLIHLHGQEKKYDVILYANKKFTGGVGDEDESQPENDDSWREYCLAPPETATDLICMTKLNGEAAHFSGRYINDQFFIITGSKNVHILIRNADDIDKYEGERYFVAKQVARAVCDTLKRLEENPRHLVYSFLHHTKCTAVCEILQPNYQHIVNLSYLEEPQLNVITFTSTLSNENELSLTALPPHYTLEVLSVLGFQTPSYSTVLPKDMASHQHKVKTLLNSEGEVLYYINDKGDTIGMAKVKSMWYVMMRALREKAIFCFLGAKRRQNWSLESMIRLMKKRFEEIQEWLNFSDEYLNKWKNLGALFLKWLEKEIEEKRVSERNIQPQFPILWARFMREANETDAFISS